VGEVEAKIHLVFWRKNDCLFFWFSVEIHGGSVWYPVLAWAHTELSMLLKQVYGCPVVPTAVCAPSRGSLELNYRVVSLLGV